MKIPFLALVFLIFLVLTSCNDQKGKVLLTIGVANNSTSNMMLSLTGYKDFLKHDFGWEDKYFLIGHSDAGWDQGQMSAWFIMNAIGLFRMDGGCRANPIYEIGSPLFEEITIDLGGRYGRGKSFTIRANGVSRLNKYVQSASLNGKELNTLLVPGQRATQGWGIAPGNGARTQQKLGAEASSSWQ